MTVVKLGVAHRSSTTQECADYLREFADNLPGRGLVAVAIAGISADGSMHTVFVHPDGAHCTPGLIGATEYLKHRLLTEALEAPASSQ